MHDPMTVAHEIKSPIKRRSKLWPKGYRNALVTIWHVDPEDRRGMCGIRRADDTCGWFTPPYSQEDRDLIFKLGEREYSDIWGKLWAVQEGKDYAGICFEPSAYDAIYWAWRAIKHAKQGPGRWKYGDGRLALTAAELQEIYQLSASPIDNLRLRVMEVNSDEDAGNFFLLIFGLYLRHWRPWYRHPRWHFWHWKIQIHALQKLNRRIFTRCEGCKKPFGWNESPVGTWSGDKVWHSSCFPSGPVMVAPDAAAGVFQAVPPQVTEPAPMSDTRH